MAGKGPEIEVLGLNRLIRTLKKAERQDLLDAIIEAQRESAKIVEQSARQKVPVQSGTLAASLRSSGTARASYVRAGRKRVPYAGVIHFGWPRRNIRPQPFLFDALDARRNEVEKQFEQRIADLASRINASE